MSKKTLTFDEKANGWTSFYSYNPELMTNLHNDFYSFKGGQLYIHNVDSDVRNTFYGETFSTEIEFVSNQGPSDVKIFKTIEIEGDSKEWDVTVATDIESGHVNKADFENKEGFKYSYIRRNAVDEVKTELLSVQGIGNLLSFGGDPTPTTTTTTLAPTTTTTTATPTTTTTTATPTTTTTTAPPPALFLQPNGVTISAYPETVGGQEYELNGTSYLVVSDKNELTQAYSVGRNMSTVVTTKVTDMSFVFAGEGSFNEDISSWDTSNVTNMRQMFDIASSFNQNIGSWNVGNVTNAFQMFNQAGAFNQDIGGWDVSSMSNMSRMLRRTSSFNQDIGGWDTSSAINMDGMFDFATSFNQDLSGWCVSNIPTEPSLFYQAFVENWTLPKPVWGTCPGGVTTTTTTATPTTTTTTSAPTTTTTSTTTSTTSTTTTTAAPTTSTTTTTTAAPTTTTTTVPTTTTTTVPTTTTTTTPPPCNGTIQVLTGTITGGNISISEGSLNYWECNQEWVIFMNVTNNDRDWVSLSEITDFTITKDGVDATSEFFVIQPSGPYGNQISYELRNDSPSPSEPSSPTYLINITVNPA